MVTEPETASQEYQRRRRSRKAARTGSTESWNTRARRLWRKGLVPVMAVITALWVAGTYYLTYQDAVMLGPYTRNLGTTDALYAFGKPDAKMDHHGRERWVYRDGSKVIALDFPPGRSLANAACTSTSRSPADCPDAHGVRLGMTEDQVWHLLGEPSVQRFQGTTKVIAYPGVGLTLKLEQFRVSVIAVQPDNGLFSILPATVRKLVP